MIISIKISRPSAILGFEKVVLQNILGKTNGNLDSSKISNNIIDRLDEINEGSQKFCSAALDVST